MPHELFLTKLVVAKVCHDLATPLNALSLGLEMSQDDSLKKDVKDLIQQSAEIMKSRLKLFRSLWSASPNAPTFQEAKEILHGSALVSKVDLSWTISPHVVEPPTSSPTRLLLGLACIALESMPRGGALSITITTTLDMSISAEGPMAQLRPGYKEIFMSDSTLENQSSRTILPFYVRLLAYVCEKHIFHNAPSVGSFQIGCLNSSPSPLFATAPKPRPET